MQIHYYVKALSLAEGKPAELLFSVYFMLERSVQIRVGVCVCSFV